MNAIDYNKLFEREAERLKGGKLLLHCCCAPCTLGVIERVMPYFDVTLYWYNPNIMPKEECQKRLAEMEKTAAIFSLPLIKEEWDNDRFINAVRGMEDLREGGERCALCIDMRIVRAAKYASENGFDAYTTTLSVSPHKNAEIINRFGEAAAEKAVWLHSDFKKKEGFKRSGQLCAQYDVYRQNYCGCKLK